MILLTEEVLLEALCFDFVVESAHAELVELFEAFSTDRMIQEFAWSLAHDTYRTPLCILYTPKVIAAACYVLAQRIYDGPNSPSLDARTSASAPSTSLPTPPTHKPPSPDATRYVVDHYSFSEAQLTLVSGSVQKFYILPLLTLGTEALSIILEFYSVQDPNAHSHLESITSVPPPSSVPRPGIYTPAVPPVGDVGSVLQLSEAPLDRTPNSTHGGQTPTKVSTGSPTSTVKS
ncbi:hypothetical protein AX16_003689 [Volvariella volvacea WC 439]|nr:hypothetical protein AX16_003689 [Volvariella volvacea WC 439]